MSCTSSGRKTQKTWELQAGQPNLSSQEEYRANPSGNNTQVSEEDWEPVSDLEQSTLIYLRNKNAKSYTSDGITSWSRMARKPWSPNGQQYSLDMNQECGFAMTKVTTPQSKLLGLQVAG